MAKSRKFQRDRARVVITLYVEVPHAYLHRQPRWKADAMSILRDLAEGLTPQQLLNTVRRRPGSFTILEEKAEVAS